MHGGIAAIAQDALNLANSMQQSCSASQVQQMIQMLQVLSSAAAVAKGREQESFRRKQIDVYRALPTRIMRLDTSAQPTLPALTTNQPVPINWPLPGVVLGWTAGTITQGSVPDGLAECSLAITKENSSELIFKSTGAGQSFMTFASIQGAPGNFFGWFPCEEAIAPNLVWQVTCKNEQATRTYTHYVEFAVLEYYNAPQIS